MSELSVDISASGVVMLGDDVSCDGFHRDYATRIQTHIHLDHMDKFETSKGQQNIYLAAGTLDLLIAEFNADLPVRENLVPLDIRQTVEVGSSRLTLLPADHMLGLVQVHVELQSGLRVGYSGDFHWPLDDVIEVDQLVVDSTYGSPRSVRRYEQSQAEERLLEIVQDRLHAGPVHVRAHRGTLHRGLEVLSAIESCAMIASAGLCREVAVYQKHGYPIGTVHDMISPEAVAAASDGRYIRFYGKGDRFPVQTPTGTTIRLSAFMSSPDDPVLEYSERCLCIALTNHADFNGTIEYVKATGAQSVVTDNARGGHAVELANEISARLGIPARPSISESSHEWGV